MCGNGRPEGQVLCSALLIFKVGIVLLHLFKLHVFFSSCFSTCLSPLFFIVLHPCDWFLEAEERACSLPLVVSDSTKKYTRQMNNGDQVVRSFVTNSQLCQRLNLCNCCLCSTDLHLMFFYLMQCFDLFSHISSAWIFYSVL